MEVAVIPDERDGLHDEIVGRENDLAAIEVKLDGDGVVVENNLGEAIEVWPICIYIPGSSKGHK